MPLCIINCDGRSGSATAAAAAKDYNKHELLGSRSYLYIDMDAALLLPQIEITTHKQSQQQIILLKVLLEDKSFKREDSAVVL